MPRVGSNVDPPANRRPEMTTANLGFTQEELDQVETLGVCDHCDEWLTEAETLAYECECQACHDERWFTCTECESETETSDRHAKHQTMCESCGGSKEEELREEALDAAKSELDDLLDQVKDTDDQDVLRRAIKSLKRLTQ
jgi:hypothetical protein